MGVVGGAQLSLLFVALLVGGGLSVAIGQAGNKRSAENIQFGNQQNLPVTLLDDAALPGAFPSSETSDEAGSVKEEGASFHGNQDEPDVPQATANGEDGGSTLENEISKQHEDNAPRREEEDLSESPRSNYERRREDDDSERAPLALASRWGPIHGAQLYQPYWGGPLEFGSMFPTRRRRSTSNSGHSKSPPRGPIEVIRAGHRHKRDLRRYRRDLANSLDFDSNLLRYQRDLPSNLDLGGGGDLGMYRRDQISNIDLDKLLRNIDVVELLAMLTRPSHHSQAGFGTVSYAPLAPAPPRFAPQPKLFPDYDDEEEEDSMDVLTQDHREAPSRHPEAVVMPPVGRMWKRTGGYGLSVMPGFKRSAFRANNPQPPPPPPQLSNGGVYSLAAMLGAELDPVTHRLRRAAM